MKLNVLGTDYEIIRDNTGKNPKLKDNMGLCEGYSKKIIIENSEEYKNDVMAVENFDEFQNKVLRHEIIHAFLMESGIDECCSWGRDEMMVDWVARQIPKMVKAMTETNCLGGDNIEKA